LTLRSTDELFGLRKSQIAIEYCYRFKEKNPTSNIFWVHASNVARFDQAYKHIAASLRLPGHDNPEIDTLQLLCDWLSNENNGAWLMILDNADDIQMFGFGPRPSLPDTNRSKPLHNYLPRSAKGSIVITTRDKRVSERLADREKSLEVLPLPAQESRQLLQQNLHSPHEWETEDASELLHTLEFLPLAITQAAAFIRENVISLAEYMKLLRKSDSHLSELLNEDIPDSRRVNQAEHSVFRTWQISFNHIREQKPRAAELLSLMAVLDRHEIPKWLLYRENESEVEFITALGVLKAFSLIAAEKEGEAFAMHRLVQLSTQRWLDIQDEKDKWQEQALELLAEKFPTSRYENWKICEALSPHAQVVLSHRYLSKSNQLHLATLLRNLACYEMEQGQNNIAIEHATESFNMRKQLLGERDTLTLDSLELVALLRGKQGHYKDSEKLHRQVLQAREELLGKEHPDTLTSYNNLASVLERQGQYDAAKEMHQQALEGGEKVLGKEHPGTLASYNNLASVLENQGQYDAAKEMYQRVLEGSEKVLGKEHPDTLTGYHNLGSILQEQGQYDAANEMYQRVLEGRENVLGKEHPKTLASYNNLASVLARQGQYDAAKEMYQRAIEGSEKVLGKEHPDTLASYNNLALVLASRGQYAAAEELHQKALHRVEEVLGKEHPDTVLIVWNLAALFHRRRRYEDAAGLYERALLGFEKALGPNHPRTIRFRGHYSDMKDEWQVKQSSEFISQGEYAAVEELYRKILDKREEVLGKEHPDTLFIVWHLAALFHKQRRFEDASVLYERALAGFEKALRLDHPDSVRCREDYSAMNETWRLEQASVLKSQGEYSAAEELY
jgi:pentatricopeptide repeat protein